jgi:hypothetical protein
MTDWRREIRHGVRALAASPGFTAVTVLSLALAIGVNTAVLAVARAVLLAPLAVANPAELRLVYWSAEKGARMFTTLLVFFGGFALMLACIGLHGVTSYAVARRTSEIGVRMALGAQRRQVLWLVLRQVVVLAAIGLAVGLPVAAAASRSVRALLFGVERADPWSLAAGALAMLAVAVGSGYLPARRAARLDPLVALRRE